MKGENIWSEFTHPFGMRALSVLGILVSQSAYILSLQHAPTAEANMINYLWPVHVILLGALLNGEKIGSRGLIGIILGVLGCAVILLGDAKTMWSDEYAPGYALAFLAGLLWAIYQVCMRKYYAENSTSIQGGPFLIYAAISFTIFYFQTPAMPEIPQALYPDLLAFGIIPVSYLFWEVGIKLGNYRLLAFCAYFIPLLSAVFIALAMGTEFSPSLFVGGAMIVAAAIIGGKSKHTIKNSDADIPVTLR